MKLLVEFTLDDSWEAYFANDEQRLNALIQAPALDGVEARIVKKGEINARISNARALPNKIES